MLFQIVNGNLSYRIELVKKDKKFNEIAKSLNDFAEKMQRANYEYPFLKVAKIKSKDRDEPLILIQKVQEYILNNLEKTLPTTNELSQMFGTNEFTLKESFRNLLNTSIYQYYNDERLKKAHLLIQQTHIPLINISVQCGFKNYTTFFRAFQKKYQYAPSELPRSENATDQ